jgi:hypothetical protein
MLNNEIETILRGVSNDIDQIIVQKIFKPLSENLSKPKADKLWGTTSAAALLARQRIRNELGAALEALIKQAEEEARRDFAQELANSNDWRVLIEQELAETDK